MSYYGVIYKYTSPSNKVYIGQTYNENLRRKDFRKTCEKYAGNKFENARKKYGVDKFTYIVLCRVEANSVQELKLYLNRLERLYIKKYDSITNGYNISEGGGTKMKQDGTEVDMYSIDAEYIRTFRTIYEAENYINGGSVSSCIKGKIKTTKGYMFTYHNQPLNIKYIYQYDLDEIGRAHV